jgi:Domain of unknown function (DUF4350)
MPLNLTGEDRRLLIITAVVFVLASALAILLSPGGEADEQFATTYSTVSEGAKAAYLLLQESGYHVERWQRSPEQLPTSGEPVLLLTDPTATPDPREIDALSRFVSNGGTLILAGHLAFMFTSSPPPVPLPLATESWETFSAITPSAQARGASSIKLNTSERWLSPSAGIPLYGDDRGSVVMQFPMGKGQILWLASASLLSNAGLREAHNLEFLLASVGSPEHPVLWDEYFHGHRESAPVPAAVHSQVKWLTAQLAFFALAVLFTFSRRSGPERTPPAESRLSSLEFVSALGDLYERVGTVNLAVDIYYERFRNRLARRLGLRSTATPEELARAAHDRYQIDDPGFVALLKTCESARFYQDLPRKEGLDLVQKLHEYASRLKLFNAAIEEKP